MIYLYWPRKKVPEWLANISFSGKGHGTPEYFHNGFGFVIKRCKYLHVYPISGYFIQINGKGMFVELGNRDKAVFIHSTIFKKYDSIIGKSK